MPTSKKASQTAPSPLTVALTARPAPTGLSSSGKVTPRWLNTDDAAAYLRTTRGALAQLRLSLTGPAFHRVGTKILYDVADLDAYIVPGRVKTAGAA